MIPRITLLAGDRNGIGPELVARFISTSPDLVDVDIEFLGDIAVLNDGAQIAGVSPDQNFFRLTPYFPVDDIVTRRGTECADAGREVLALLSHAVKRVQTGESDGVVFAPLNKAAMHLGGLTHEDEMQFLIHELGWQGPAGELNVLGSRDSLWTTRITSHIPLRDVAAHITTEAVLEGIRFADTSLKAAGFDRPRVGVAALNPHAGDGGNFGREEIDIIAPAVEQARQVGIVCTGPLPSDTVFVRAKDGQFDIVVTMFHDQGQIAMKLMSFGRGVTVLGGLPVPVTTCGHGTAYDIAGQGVAKVDSFNNAFAICREMALTRIAEKIA